MLAESIGMEALGMAAESGNLLLRWTYGLQLSETIRSVSVQPDVWECAQRRAIWDSGIELLYNLA